MPGNKNKEAQKIINSIYSYMRSHPSGQKQKLLDELQRIIDENRPYSEPKGKGASNSESPDKQETKDPREQQQREEVLKNGWEKEEMAAWERWRTASENYETAKRNYDKWKAAEEYFETSIRPLNEPFRQVTELLSYFVPCRTGTDYEQRAAVLLNKQRYLCGSLQPGKWGERLTSNCLSQLRLPDDEPQPVEMDKNQIPFESSENSSDAVKNVKKYKKEAEELDKKASAYLHDSEQMESARLQNRRLWENAMLLRDFLPAIELLQQFEGAEAPHALAAEIGAKLADAVANHRCIDPEMRFLWLFPDDDAYQEYLSVRLGFIAAEADCPGLYYTDGTGIPVCVVPGRIVEKE